VPQVSEYRDLWHPTLKKNRYPKSVILIAVFTRMVYSSFPPQIEGGHMAHFLFQGSYTAESLAALVETPEDRSVYVRSIVEKLGGKLEGFWLAFGEHDFYLIAEMPDNATATAFAISASAGGGVHHFSTVPLFTWSEGLAAMKQAKLAGYRPPMKRGK